MIYINYIYIYVCCIYYIYFTFYMYIYIFNHNKEGNPAFVTTWMDLEDIILGELSKKR